MTHFAIRGGACSPAEAELSAALGGIGDPPTRDRLCTLGRLLLVRGCLRLATMFAVAAALAADEWLI